MNNKVGIDAGDDIVQDNAISSPHPLLEGPNGEGFNNIEGSENEKAKEYVSPGRGNNEHCDQESNHLINDDMSAIPGLEDNLSSIRSPNGNVD